MSKRKKKFPSDLVGKNPLDFVGTQNRSSSELKTQVFKRKRKCRKNHNNNKNNNNK